MATHGIVQFECWARCFASLLGSAILLTGMAASGLDAKLGAAADIREVTSVCSAQGAVAPGVDAVGVGGFVIEQVASPSDGDAVDFLVLPGYSDSGQVLMIEGRQILLTRSNQEPLRLGRVVERVDRFWWGDASGRGQTGYLFGALSTDEWRCFGHMDYYLARCDGHTGARWTVELPEYCSPYPPIPVFDDDGLIVGFFCYFDYRLAFVGHTGQIQVFDRDLDIATPASDQVWLRGNKGILYCFSNQGDVVRISFSLSTGQTSNSIQLDDEVSLLEESLLFLKGSQWGGVLDPICVSSRESTLFIGLARVPGMGSFVCIEVGPDTCSVRGITPPDLPQAAVASAGTGLPGSALILSEPGIVCVLNGDMVLPCTAKNYIKFAYDLEVGQLFGDTALVVRVGGQAHIYRLCPVP